MPVQSVMPCQLVVMVVVMTVVMKTTTVIAMSETQ